MAQKERKIRIKDIAEKAGVSTGTIDRVLHNRGEVNAETRKKVMDIVNEMGYTPNLVARSLAIKKTTSIAVLFPDPQDNNPYWQQPISGIESGIKELNDYNVQVETITFTATDERSYIQATESILENKPNGVVFNPVFKRASLAFIDRLNEENIPFIFFDINIPKANSIAYYGQDAYQSGQAAARLMLNAIDDPAKILLVNMANHKRVSHHLKTRASGFSNFMENSPKQGIQIETLNIDLLEKEEPEKSLSEWFSKNENIAGVFAPNTRVFKVAEFLQSHSGKKPVLIGYDIIRKNIEAVQNNTIDFLICQKPEEQAYKAIMAMFNFLISGKQPDKVNYSPIDIIFKENMEFYTHVE